MAEKEIESFDDFHRWAISLGDRVIYRGQANSIYELKPKIARGMEELPEKEFSKREKRIFGDFKRMSHQYLTIVPNNDWEWLAIGQHHGLPTRFLDWTTNPLVALYFAVDFDLKSEEKNGAVFALEEAKHYRPVPKGATYFEVEQDQPNKDGLPFESPLDIKYFGKYWPTQVERRIAAQEALFTVHHQPQVSVDNVIKVVVPEGKKTELKRTLFNYGVHQKSLFPDLDGLAQHLEWKYHISNTHT